MPVGLVADSGHLYGGHAYSDARAAARTRHVSVVVPVRRQRWVIGQAGFLSDDQLLAQGEEFHADILKGGHGSGDSATAESVEAAHPRFAIVSGGRRNLSAVAHLPRWKHCGTIHV